MNALRVAIIFILLPVFAAGQGKWELGVLGGGTNYQGDLVVTVEPLLTATKPAYGGFIRHSFDFRWSMRLNFLHGTLYGSDQSFMEKYRNRRNFSFESVLLESSLILEWEPFGKKRIKGDWLFNRILSPYLFVGIGGLAVDSQTDYSLATNDGILDLIRQDQGVQNPHFHPAIPIGFGLKYDISKKILIAVEVGSRATFTDYLDGISSTANPDKNDWYIFGGMTLSYLFNPKDSDKDGIADRADSCPKVPGVESSRGCPDSDGDGVEDLEDICPDIAGLPELNGCPDRDNDGIADFEDECPATPGSIFTRGCPDTDGDRITDTEDECPLLAGPLCRRGCPPLDVDADGHPDDAGRCSLCPPDYLKGVVRLNKKIGYLTKASPVFPLKGKEPL